jgi:hypothetical protein
VQVLSGGLAQTRVMDLRGMKMAARRAAKHVIIAKI